MENRSLQPTRKRPRQFGASRDFSPNTTPLEDREAKLFKPIFLFFKGEVFPLSLTVEQKRLQREVEELIPPKAV